MNDFYPDFYLVFERVRDEEIVLYPEPAGDYGDVKHLAKDDGVIEVARLALVHPAVSGLQLRHPLVQEVGQVGRDGQEDGL